MTQARGVEPRPPLPTWIVLGACALACIAGMVNVVGFLGFEHQGITHLTGLSTLLGAALGNGDMRAAVQLASVIGAFVAGATFSGLVVHDTDLQLGRRYGLLLALEALLLVASASGFKHGHMAGGLLAAMACGLQNALATTWRGTLIRTTHVSGLYTDLGIALGHALRRRPLQRARTRLAVLTVGAFITGCVCGAVLFGWLQYDALYVPAAWTGLVGLGYALYRHRLLSKAPESSHA